MKRAILVLMLMCVLPALAQHRPPENDVEKEDPTWAPPPMVKSWDNQPIYRLNDEDIKAPSVSLQPDPPPLKDFRTARVVLWCVVGQDGKAHLIKVAKRDSLEADMKAAENLKQWKFKPGEKKKEGTVNVLMTVEVVWR